METKVCTKCGVKKPIEDFIKVLYEEAEGQQQKQQLRETLQRSMM